MKTLYDVIELQDDKPIAIAKLKIPDNIYQTAFEGDNEDYWPEYGPAKIDVEFIWKEEGAKEDFLSQFLFPTSKEWVRKYNIRRVVKEIFGEYMYD